MRWTRRNKVEDEPQPVASGWHEGAHWVAGAGAVVHAERAGDLVAPKPQAA